MSSDRCHCVWAGVKERDSVLVGEGGLVSQRPGEGGVDSGLSWGGRRSVLRTKGRGSGIRNPGKEKGWGLVEGGRASKPPVWGVAVVWDVGVLNCHSLRRLQGWVVHSLTQGCGPGSA